MLNDKTHTDTMKKIITTLAILAFAVNGINAQVNKTANIKTANTKTTANATANAMKAATTVAENAKIQAYVDSLRLYRQRLDEAVAGNDSLRKALLPELSGKSDYAEVTMPLTYYHDVVQRQFDIDADTTHVGRQAAQDNAMMSMYVSHPELISDSERNLREAGTIEHLPETPVRNDAVFTQPKTAAVPAPVVSGPVDIIAVRPNFWTFAGDYSLQFMQNFVSGNWYKGGESTYSMIGSVTLQANYNNKQKIKWDNKLEMKLGLMTSPGDTAHDYKTSEDLIRLTSKLGIQATKRWYYTIQAIAYTQFLRSYKTNETTPKSDFMSPFNLNVSLGMDYTVEWLNKHLTGSINISPLAMNYRYVSRSALVTSYSIDEGKHSLVDLGSTLTADLTWKFSDNVKWQTRLYGYTTYKRVEMEWENTLTFQLSKYISTNLFVYPRFDDSTSRDDKYGYFQLKEYWSLGFNYSF